MRILLISANTERINMLAPPLGLGLVATATRRAGHEVTFLDLLCETEPEVAIQRAIETGFPASTWPGTVVRLGGSSRRTWTACR